MSGLGLASQSLSSQAISSFEKVAPGFEMLRAGRSWLMGLLFAEGPQGG
jgi:hypothetical protein